MISNRRQSKVAAGFGSVVARAWQLRHVFLIAASYLLLFGWLFSGGSESDMRPAEVLVTPESPIWEKPDADHWFGTTGSGVDLFELSRVAMATTVATAAIASAAGVGLGLLLVMLFAFDPGERRFALLRSAGRVQFLVPSMASLVILAGGSGGSLAVTVITISILVALHLGPVIAAWFEDGERRSDVTAGYVVGLTRREIVTNRIVPVVLRRLIGVFAVMVPAIALAEMGLSFLGFAGNRLSCGAIVAYGQEVIIEAPWVAVGPGILASVVVLLFAFLGWLASAALRSGTIPRVF